MEEWIGLSFTHTWQVLPKPISSPKMQPCWFCRHWVSHWTPSSWYLLSWIPVEDTTCSWAHVSVNRVNKRSQNLAKTTVSITNEWMNEWICCWNFSYLLNQTSACRSVSKSPSSFHLFGFLFLSKSPTCFYTNTTNKYPNFASPHTPDTLLLLSAAWKQTLPDWVTWCGGKARVTQRK